MHIYYFQFLVFSISVIFRLVHCFVSFLYKTCVMLFYSVPNSMSIFEHVLIHFELGISLVKEVLVLSVKSVRQMWNNLENHQHVNIAILLLHSLATSVNGAPTQRRNMDLQWHVNSANRNVPLIGRMKIKRYFEWLSLLYNKNNNKTVLLLHYIQHSLCFLVLIYISQLRIMLVVCFSSYS